ncbi:antimicrobial peptide system protein%2C SdpA family [Mycobacteroides abscessus]|nr:antimicrobial peptide system protein%2C SdpA family [Mycobacteroides abscessus]
MLRRERRQRPIHGRRAVMVLWLYSTVLMVAFLSTLIATMPSNVLVSEADTVTARVYLNTLASQNFAFFTRPPQSDQFDIYRKDSSGTFHSLLVTPQGRSENLFGIGRRQRAQGPEVADLTRAMPRWESCSGLYDECLSALSNKEPFHLVNNSPVATVCGDVIFTVESTVKWSYRSLVDYGLFMIEGVERSAAVGL